MPAQKNILIFRPGQLGDSIVALPALWALREAYPEAKLTWLHDKQIGKTLLSPEDVFVEKNELINDFITYPYYACKIKDTLSRIKLFITLRAHKFDTLCYLPPSSRSVNHRQRDINFFTSCGTKQILGANLGVEDYTNWREADVFLKSIESELIPFPGRNDGKMALPNSCLVCETPTVKENTLAVFIGSNFKEKEFPVDRWISILKAILAAHSVTPLFLGDQADAENAETIINALQRGENGCGRYSIAQTIHMLELCRCCIGIDSGGIHLASLAKCSSLVLSHGLSEPGRWDPYGTGHKVLRAETPGLTSSIPDEKILAEFKQMLDS